MSRAKQTNLGANRHQACPDKAVAFIRARYPSKTADHVAADTGVPVNTVKRWLEGVAKPSWEACWALICSYGLPFMAATVITRPQWLDDAHRAARLAALEAEQARIKAEIAELV